MPVPLISSPYLVSHSHSKESVEDHNNNTNIALQRYQREEENLNIEY